MKTVAVSRGGIYTKITNDLQFLEKFPQKQQMIYFRSISGDSFNILRDSHKYSSFASMQILLALLNETSSVLEQVFVINLQICTTDNFSYVNIKQFV
ncbi:CLUMA_CG010559, isoform A [Clunio marinus]|uniref:CLUMA_CG010559, isoform A n=1 Tax=Clunio marinus TaxID=568069 RepID=A0A1J1IBP4_9DIPT|nr:CLUMA_CG010559, isoform A [Clunio marinus]